MPWRIWQEFITGFDYGHSSLTNGYTWTEDSIGLLRPLQFAQKSWICCYLDHSSSVEILNFSVTLKYVMHAR